jgi:hypothetical protein
MWYLLEWDGNSLLPLLFIAVALQCWEEHDEHQVEKRGTD